jgi:hypothetical protein
MSNQRHGQSPQGKPSHQSGIRTPGLQELTQRIDVVEKLIKDYLDEKNQRNSKVREWLDKSVKVQLVSSLEVSGVFSGWIDTRFTCHKRDSTDYHYYSQRCNSDNPSIA